MADMTQVDGAARARRGLLSRIIGVIISPRETFQAVAAEPKWLGVMAVVVAVVAGATVGFTLTDTGPQAALGALQQLFAGPVNLARGSMSNPANLAVFVPMLDESSFLVRFLGMIDLFYVWQTVVLAIGLAVLYRRRAQPIIVSLLLVYALVA